MTEFIFYEWYFYLWQTNLIGKENLTHPMSFLYAKISPVQKFQDQHHHMKPMKTTDPQKFLETVSILKLGNWGSKTKNQKHLWKVGLHVVIGLNDVLSLHKLLQNQWQYSSWSDRNNYQYIIYNHHQNSYKMINTFSQRIICFSFSYKEGRTGWILSALNSI